MLKSCGTRNIEIYIILILIFISFNISVPVHKNLHFFKKQPLYNKLHVIKKPKKL